jgi:ketosteroid isomerase-like protein
MATDRIAAAERFLDLLEAGDGEGIEGMLDENIVWIAPMTATGDAEDAEPAEGIDAFRARVRQIGGLIGSACFVDRRVTATEDGTTTFVQARGDFRTKSGEPYRNVYVFRFDWRDGKIVTWEEYANPVTILRAFPELAPA